MASADIAALADFQGFAEALQSITSVYYVSGGEVTLAKWVAALICRYAAENAEVSHHAVATETRSELFLRRAGMNVYAAQAILGMMRAPPGVPAVGTGRAYGLVAFLKLELDQRMSYFEEMLGGGETLAMVSRTVDKGWED
ncbi:hypothetical protein GQ53DRAFT_741132 [Thozetella sp. PMI_491]|nr:hypothetical protein GQ53DRAFT_741132 [Thozetella sp. PMI_491]